MTHAQHPAAFYPPTYRQLEVQTIVAAIRGHWSIVVSGLVGAGKSHLMHFLASNEEFKAHYFDQDSTNLIFVFVDCILMDGQDEQGFYKGLIAMLCQQCTLVDNIDLQGATDVELVLALQRCLDSLYREQLTVVFVLDRFEKFYQNKKLNYILDNLRYLRDHFARHISYILAVRGETDITSASEKFEDLLYTPTVVYLKPLTPADARDLIIRYERDYRIDFEHEEKRKLISYTGGYPRLLQVACDLAREGKIDLTADDTETIRQLFNAAHIQNACQKIWEELTNKDRTILRLVTSGRSTLKDDSRPVRYGLVQTVPGSQSEIFCPLFETFVRENQDLNLTLQLVPPNKVLRGTDIIQLAPLEINFLACLLENPGQVCTYDAIIAKVYPEATSAEGISSQALAGLAKRVRNKINLPGHDLIENVRGIGYLLNLAPGIARKQR